MTLNPKVALLLLGLLVGAVAGYLTKPGAAQITVGDVSLEFSNNRVSSGSPDGLTAGQSQHILLYTLIGGVAGLLVGFALDRRR